MILTFLALVFGLHIVMVNLGIGLSGTVPFLKRKAEIEGNEEIMRIARKSMKFYAATYALAGVFGTAFTVFLLSFYPSFIGLAGNIALVPFALSVCMIVLHFLSLTLYWYGWDKFNSERHFIVGLVMFISALLIPLGFRAIFGFLNVPIGLELTPKVHIDTLKALTNPTFLVLYPKSITASFALTFVILATAFRKSEYSKSFAKLGLAFLILTSILGIAYAETLESYANYKFTNVFGVFYGVKPENNVSYVFIIKMVFLAIQFIALMALLRGKDKLMPLAGFSALATVYLGEMLNAFSQYPLFIANTSVIPKEIANALADVINMAKPNPIATMESLYAVTLAFLIPLIASACVLIYLIVRD